MNNLTVAGNATVAGNLSVTGGTLLANTSTPSVSTETGPTAGYYYLGRWTAIGQSSTGRIRIDGVQGYNGAQVNAGETVVYLRVLNSNLPGGYFSGTTVDNPAITDVKWAPTTNTYGYDIYVNAGAYHHLSTYFEGNGTWTPAGTYYGASAPIASTAFPSVWSAATAGAERMRIDAAGNVGIGTTTPLAKLDVTGATLGRVLIGDDPTYIPQVGLYKWSGGGSTYYGNRIASSNSGAMKLQVAPFNAIGSHSFVDVMTLTQAGNVGIGTDTPGVFWNDDHTTPLDLTSVSRVFEITGSAGKDAALVVSAGPGRIGRLVFENTISTAGNRITEFVHGQDIIDLQSVNENTGAVKSIMVWNTSSGNVGLGIGTTAPAAKLDVAGDGRFSGSLSVGAALSAASLTINGQAFDPLFYLRTNTTALLTPGSLAINNYTQGMRINQAADGYAILHLGGNTATGTGAGQWTLLSDPYGMFGIWENGYKRVTILPGSGNVGIGTSTPPEKLTVDGPVGVASGAPTALVPGLLGGRHAGIGFAIDTNYEATVAYGYGYGENAVFQVAAKPYNPDYHAAWNPSASTLLTVTGGGKLGIGTTTPAAMLDVRSLGGPALRIFDGDSSVNATIEMKRADGWNPVTIQNVYPTTGAFEGQLNFNLHPADGILATAPAPVMTLKGNGNVGIGTKDPQAQLHLVGSPPWAQQPAPTALRVDAGYATGKWLSLQDTSNSELFGVARVSNGALFSTWAGGASDLVFAPGNAASKVLVRGAASQTADVFQVQNSSAAALLNVAADGTVGVGTWGTEPGLRLLVGGDGRFSHVIAESTQGDAAFFGHQANSGFGSLNAVFQGVTDNTTPGSNWLIRGYRGTTFRWGADFDGKLSWQGDTDLFRDAVGSLRTHGAFTAASLATTTLTIGGAAFGSVSDYAKKDSGGNLSVTGLVATGGSISGGGATGLTIRNSSSGGDTNIYLAPSNDGDVVIPKRNTLKMNDATMRSGEINIGTVTSSAT